MTDLGAGGHQFKWLIAEPGWLHLFSLVFVENLLYSVGFMVHQPRAVASPYSPYEALASGF